MKFDNEIILCTLYSVYNTVSIILYMTRVSVNNLLLTCRDNKASTKKMLIRFSSKMRFQLTVAPQPAFKFTKGCIQHFSLALLTVFPQKLIWHPMLNKFSKFLQIHYSNGHLMHATKLRGNKK